MAVMVAIGADDDGCREVIGAAGSLGAPGGQAEPGRPVVMGGRAETPAHAGFPRERRRGIGAGSAAERVDREARGRARAVGTFPDGRSAPMPVTAWPKRALEGGRGARRHPDATPPGGRANRGNVQFLAHFDSGIASR